MEVLVRAFEDAAFVDHQLESEIGKCFSDGFDKIQIECFPPADIVGYYPASGIFFQNLIELIDGIYIIDYGDIELVISQLDELVNHESAVYGNDVRFEEICRADQFA